MTEEEELMRFGNAMYKIKANGEKVHIPREKWDVFYKGNKETKNDK